MLRLKLARSYRLKNINALHFEAEVKLHLACYEWCANPSLVSSGITHPLNSAVGNMSTRRSISAKGSLYDPTPLPIGWKGRLAGYTKTSFRQQATTSH